MATREQIYEALKRADAAGNVEDAKALARAYAAMPAPAPQGNGDITKLAGFTMGKDPFPKQTKQQEMDAALMRSPMAPLVQGAVVDPALGIMQLAAHGTKLVPGLKPLAKPAAEYMDRTVNETNNAYDVGRRNAGVDPNDFDWSRLAGNVMSPVNYIGGGGGGTTLLARLLQGATTGAIASASQPVDTRGGQDYATQKAMQVGVGGLGGTALEGVMAGGGKIINAMRRGTPATRALWQKDVQALEAQGVPLTIGQRMGGTMKDFEDKISSLPVVGGLVNGARRRSIEGMNANVYNEALKPLGQTLPANIQPGREAVDYVSNEISKAYDGLLPKLAGSVDQQLVTDLQGVGNKLIGEGAPQTVLDRLSNVLKAQINDRIGPNGVITGEQLKIAQSDLGRIGRKLASSPPGDDQTLGHAVLEAQQKFNDMLERLNPSYRGDLQKINQAFARNATIQRAASMLGAKDGVFSPANFANAVKSGDKSVRHNQYARGKAFMQDLSDPANRVLPSSVPDSGTAGRLLANALIGGSLLGSGTGFLDPKTAGILALVGSAYSRPGQALLKGAHSGARTAAPYVGGLLGAVRPSLIPFGVIAGNQAMQSAP